MVWSWSTTVTMQMLEGLMTGASRLYRLKDNPWHLWWSHHRQFASTHKQATSRVHGRWHMDWFVPTLQVFSKIFPFPSFNVKDLDTVDRVWHPTCYRLWNKGHERVEKSAGRRRIPPLYLTHIESSMKMKRIGTWSLHIILLIMLGTHLPRHPSMTRKLRSWIECLQRACGCRQRHTSRCL